MRATVKHPAISSESLLAEGSSFENRAIDLIVWKIEQNLRNMCFVMLVAQLNVFNAGDYEKLVSVFGTFIEFVDGQVDYLSALRLHIDGAGFRCPSVADLQKSQEFKWPVVGREAFTSEEAYRCYTQRGTPVSAFNRAFGEFVASANRKANCDA